jgi:hypothetical protein
MNFFQSLKQKLDKRECAFCLFLAAAAAPLAAQDLNANLNTVAEKVYAVFTGTGVKVLLACFLAGSAVAYAFNKDNEKVKRNCIAIAVATAILMLSSAIVKFIAETTGTTL